jgi:hypothetical protein
VLAVEMDFHVGDRDKDMCCD